MEHRFMTPREDAIARLCAYGLLVEAPGGGRWTDPGREVLAGRFLAKA